VTTKREADAILREANGDMNYIKEKLGIVFSSPDREREFIEGGLTRVDIPFRLEDRPRLPSGMEAGANMHFKWGGFIKGGGKSEVILSNPSTNGINFYEVIPPKVKK
jgi:hypothetical protein